MGLKQKYDSALGDLVESAMGNPTQRALTAANVMQNPKAYRGEGDESLKDTKKRMADLKAKSGGKPPALVPQSFLDVVENRANQKGTKSKKTPEQYFAILHGTAFDRKSSMDNEKMGVLKKVLAEKPGAEIRELAKAVYDIQYGKDKKQA